MANQNTRTSPLEPYDPKQRIVGGVTLFVLMMLLYVILKALLGISSSGVEYALRAPLPDEVAATALASAPGVETGTAEGGSGKPAYPIINKFVFLDLSGKPMEADAGLENFDSAMPNDPVFDSSSDKKWYAQVASFKEEARASDLLRELSSKGLSAKIVKLGDWYAVRLLPLENKADVQQQLRVLQRELRIKGQVRKIE